MTSRYQPEYRRKRRALSQIEAPFPVPIASLTNIPCDENFWYQFTGYLLNDSVHVRCSGDVKYLHKMGFFGRGMLSRSAADFHQSATYVYLPTEPGCEPNIVNVMKRRTYLRHTHWKKLGDSTRPEDCDISENDAEFDSDAECVQEQGILYETEVIPPDTEAEIAEPSTVPEQNPALKDGDSETKLESWDTGEADSDFWNSEDIHSSVTKTNKESHNDEPGHSGDPANNDKAVDDWDNCEADEDFWGSSSASTSVVNSNTSKNRTENSDLDLVDKGEGRVNVDEPPPNKKRKVDENASLDLNDVTTENVDSDVSDVCSKRKESVVCGNSNDDMTEHVGNVLLKQSNAISHVNEISSFNDSKKTLDVSNNCSKASETANSSKNLSSNVSIIEKDTIKDCDSKTSIDSATCDIKSEKGSNRTFESTTCDQTLDENCINQIGKNEFDNDIIEEKGNGAHLNELKNGANKENEPHVGNQTQLNEKEFHPYCGLDEKDGDYLVIEDSDADDYETVGPMKNGYHWKPMVKKDPYPYTEPLILTAEEAFFLSYGLGCLSVIDGKSQETLTLKELWCRFCLQPRFLPCYAAYHYFRSQGWVPKSGVVFGTDFVLYKEGPPFFHGSYSVIVKAVYSGTYKAVEKYSKRNLSWTAFSGLQRITEHVAKTLLVCYVVMPPDLTEEEMTSPTCLSRVQIILQRYNRWVSSQEREQDKVLDIP